MCRTSASPSEGVKRLRSRDSLEMREQDTTIPSPLFRTVRTYLATEFRSARGEMHEASVKAFSPCTCARALLAAPFPT